jgi:hypothetical protein
MMQKDGEIKANSFFAQRMCEYVPQKMRKEGRKSSSVAPK